MYLFFTKILLVICMYHSSRGLELFEKRTELASEDETTMNTQETSVRTENGLITLLKKQPVAVVVELKEQVLKEMKAILEEEKLTFTNGKRILATFDSTGLQDVSVHNNTSDFRKAVMALQPTISENGMSTPTIHVLGELFQRDLPKGLVLIVTMSKPSDEDFAKTIIRSQTGNRFQLSVVWVGNDPENEDFLLKDLAEKTGGDFVYVINASNSKENLTEYFSPKSEFENISEQIKFPEESKEIDDKEAKFVSRAADQKVIQRAVVPLIVEVASGSSLEVRPGTPTQIQFYVKNNLNVAVPVAFNAKFNGVVQPVTPTQTLLQPSATTTVIVNLQPLGISQSVNALGTLTLLAIATNKVTARSALISLTPQTITDNTPPKMYHKYSGDCSNYKEPQNCENGQWSLEATIQDDESGLLKILSEPYGLLFQSEFVAGSKTPVTVYYSATCCQPSAIIWAEDLKGNYVKKSFDVFNQNLLAGEIASIVLGVLFVLLILIVIIVAVIFIRRRNQRNMIIPRTRSGSR